MGLIFFSVKQSETWHLLPPLPHIPTNQQTNQLNNQQTKQSGYKEKGIRRKIEGEC